MCLHRPKCRNNQMPLKWCFRTFRTALLMGGTARRATAERCSAKASEQRSPHCGGSDEHFLELEYSGKVGEALPLAWGCARFQRVLTVWAWVSQWSLYEDFSPWPLVGLFYSDEKKGILVSYGKITGQCLTRIIQYLLPNELINESNPTPNKSIRNGIQKCKKS